MQTPLCSPPPCAIKYRNPPKCFLTCLHNLYGLHVPSASAGNHPVSEMRSAGGLLLVIIIAVLEGIGCSPPAPPVKCRTGDMKDCNVSNAYGAFPDRSVCRASMAVYPSSEQEILEVVKRASKDKQKMRVVTSTSHSIPKLVCAGGDGGVVISTRSLNSVVSVDEAEGTITVQSGVTLRQLIDAAAEHDLALPYSPYWEGLTVGGMLGTGAHGSSLFGNGSALHDYVVSMRLVAPVPSGSASVVVLSHGNPDLDAAKVSLGLLGVISQVTLKLQPMFKRSITFQRKDDEDFEDNIVVFGKTHEFADFTWFPAQRSVTYRIDDRVPLSTPGNGVNDFIGFRPTLTAALALVRLTEETEEATMDGKAKCDSAKIQSLTLRAIGSGFKNNDVLFTGYPIVGFQNKLQCSGSCHRSREDSLITACGWDPRVRGLFFHQTTIAISLAKIADFVSDVKRLRDMVPESLCVLELYDGILMRFVTASSAYLGADEDSLDLDITYYRSHDPMSPRLYEDVLEEIEQMGVFKYGGAPHWGKNRNLAFLGVSSKYKHFGKFKKAVTKYDPHGLMSNEWTDALMSEGAKDVVILKDGCALEGLCICSEDRHCAPQKRYFCRPGRVYSDARVCRYEKN